jgi:hypothetical protein
MRINEGVPKMPSQMTARQFKLFTCHSCWSDTDGVPETPSDDNTDICKTQLLVNDKFVHLSMDAFTMGAFTGLQEFLQCSQTNKER